MQLNSAIEEVLRRIINKYDGNADYYVEIAHHELPIYLQGKSTDILKVLEQECLIYRYEEDLSKIEVYLTLEGINFFKEKMPSSSMQLLQALLQENNPENYMQILFANADSKTDSRLRAMMRDLKEKGYITSEWADNLPFKISFNETAYTFGREVLENTMGKMKIFISHNEKDKIIVKKFVDLLEDMGITEEQLFCSSVPGYWIPAGKDIYEYLEKQFNDNELYVIFMLSDNYYKSPACLNEMGAAWVKKSDYLSILLPGFEFQSVKGAVNPRAISFKLDDSENLRYRLNELRDSISNKLSITITNNKWERCRDNFINSITDTKGEEAVIEFIKYRVYSDKGQEHIVVNGERDFQNNYDTVHMNFSSSKLNYTPAYAGWCYYFVMPINVENYKELEIDVITDGKIEKLEVEIKPEGKNWMHDTFDFSVKRFNKLVISVKDIQERTRKCIGEICIVVKPNFFKTEADMYTEINIANIEWK